MRQAVCQYAERAAEKLRGERQYCRHISIFIKTSPFAVNEPYYGNVATEKLNTPTRDTGHYSGSGQVSGQDLARWPPLRKSGDNAQ
jgi:DNA polymerase V